MVLEPISKFSLPPVWGAKVRNLPSNLFALSSTPSEAASRSVTVLESRWSTVNSLLTLTSLALGPWVISELLSSYSAGSSFTAVKGLHFSEPPARGPGT